ncbi:hypothetical protein [Natrialbaceae archaeon AArc-T1-2]|uniref:hypothetical protein n=1 Tax=Natrialbaceae archaeon AArc-T1-2 TaxID=3053904 RepID=UPI00255AF147|nr:hypothetical protein [Natrialbaceae archaeon AArc-T1-2]WIV66505.1 hypothetical protein QQ977_12495 [Natrialbaceae archaeon AArc-T1-2]
MGTNNPDTGTLASSLHRSILGALLAIVGIVGLGMALEWLPDDNVVAGVVGLAIAVGAAVWIASLFLEGLRER